MYWSIICYKCERQTINTKLAEVVLTVSVAVIGLFQLEEKADQLAGSGAFRVFRIVLEKAKSEERGQQKR